MVKLRRVFESELYLEAKKDLDDLKNYLGDKLFDDYMKIRDRIPSPYDLKKKYPEFNDDKEWGKETEDLFIKKYNLIIEDPILRLSFYRDLPSLHNYMLDSTNIDTYLNNYVKLRDYILETYSKFRNFSRLKKQDKEYIQSFISTYLSTGDKKKSDKIEGAEKIYEDSDWAVYKITDYTAAKLYGSGTKWCITSSINGNSWFHSYIDNKNLDGGYYFYLSKKNPKEKYCVLQDKNNKIVGIFDSTDKEFQSSGDLNVELPVVKGIHLSNITLKDIKEDIKKRDYVKLKKDLSKSTFDINSQSDSLGNYHGGFMPELLKIGDAEILDIFLQSGLNPNLYLPNNKTPLIQVLDNGGDIDIINVLLKHGALPDYPRASPFEYPLDIAHKNGRDDLVQLLKKYGAKKES